MSDAPLRVAVLGASGRMGRAVLAAIGADPAVEAVSAWSRQQTDTEGWTSDLVAALERADVAIDFTLPAATPLIAAACVQHNTALVSGVTGLSDEASAALCTAATDVAVLHEHNLSLGVHVLTALVANASAWLPADFSCTVVDTHHAQKRDAPSGTAVTLAAAIRAASSHREPSVLSVRGGTVIGDHQVAFLGPRERIELSHRADDRAVFAHGAVAAAKWLATRSAGQLWRVADWLAEGNAH
ncbi:MAG: dihydrodipicolinate reductase C-terminal domain-containing protein [Pseudomonadota bacterium]